METTAIQEAKQTAEAHFASGLYCAESVLLALARLQGIESDLFPRIATGLCSGMSRSAGTCGAITGAILGMDLALGRSTSQGSVEPAYAAAQRLVKEFKAEFGECNCCALLGGVDLGTPEGQAAFLEKGLMNQCLVYTGKAAELAARILAEASQAQV